MHRNTFPPIASHLRRALIAAGLALPMAAVASPRATPAAPAER